MKGTRIAPIVQMKEELPPKGDFLLLIEPRRVPPHLAMLSDGAYFSLSAKGVELGKDAMAFFQALDRKGKECLLLELWLPEGAPSAMAAFSAYRELDPLRRSCLAPVLDRCGLSGELATVHDLIPRLEEAGMLHPPHRLWSSKKGEEERELWVPAYERKDVEAHLQRYKELKEHDRG